MKSIAGMFIFEINQDNCPIIIWIGLIFVIWIQNRLRATFEQFDADGDGILTLDEIRNAMEDMLSEEELDELLSDLYEDGIEEVDCDDFIYAMNARIENKDKIPIVSESPRYWKNCSDWKEVYSNR